ncbi:hypothetical protein VNO78_25615 [Psophocarpus tetragonolobus]|uniref:Ferritin n=1 Tax=Psophocarpus tetragonolobus TaxID=3891 RepID=A0AAN9XF61_PSOTE
MALSVSKVSTFSLSPIVGGDAPKKLLFFPFSMTFVNSSSLTLGNRNLSVCAAASNAPVSAPLTGVIFEPFEELKKDHLKFFSISFLFYNVSYVYHSLFSYFDRDNIALKGLAKFFKESSEEEREHAEKLIKNIRGGRVLLYPITSPPSEFEHAEKGDALYA